jgi:bacteriocin-like protein
MKQNDEQKDAKVMTQEELENVMGGKKKPHYPPKEK